MGTLANFLLGVKVASKREEKGGETQKKRGMYLEFFFRP